MFARFDKNGKLVSYSEAEKLEDVRPNPEGFEKISGFSETDIMYLVKENGVIRVDTEAKKTYTEKKTTGK